MKAVLISIRPKHTADIKSGKKTLELRKSQPKIPTPFKCYIYETTGPAEVPWVDEEGHHIFKGLGMVIGEFVCDVIAQYDAELWDDDTFERIREFYEPDDFAEYGEYEYQTIADNSDDFWRDNMLCKAACVSIEELRKYIGTGIHEFYGWHISELKIYDKPKKLNEFTPHCRYMGDDMCDYRKVACAYQVFDHNPWPDCSVNAVTCKRKMQRPPQSWCYVEEA